MIQSSLNTVEPAMHDRGHSHDDSHDEACCRVVFPTEKEVTKAKKIDGFGLGGFVAPTEPIINSFSSPAVPEPWMGTYGDNQPVIPSHQDAPEYVLIPAWCLFLPGAYSCLVPIPAMGPFLPWACSFQELLLSEGLNFPALRPITYPGIIILLALPCSVDTKMHPSTCLRFPAAWCAFLPWAGSFQEAVVERGLKIACLEASLHTVT